MFYGCSQDCQPQNVPNENILFGVIKCLSQDITKFAMFSAKSFQVKNLKSLVRKEVAREKMAPELKNEENLKVDDVEANVVFSKECREL